MSWLVLLVGMAVTERADVRAAVADQTTLAYDEKPHTHYLSYASTPTAEGRRDLRVATRLMVGSTSRQVVLERSAPVPMTETLARFDLRELKWSRPAFDRLLSQYPYHRYGSKGSPLVIRADWLTSQLADATVSPAYYELLLGRVPKTRDEWLHLLRVDRQADKLLRFGLVEERSGVAKQRVRWIESFPAERGYAWGTRDSLAVTDDKDPLEHPDGRFAHDGEEWIVGIPKVSTASGTRGVLQVYLLADGQGVRVDKAPVDLVEDSTRFRGYAEIRNPGSCVQCHVNGLNEPTRNALREYLLSGASLYARNKETQAGLEAFHLGDVATSIRRANEDYSAMVEVLCGVSANEGAAAFRRAIEHYHAPLDLTAASHELGVSESAMRDALAKQHTIAQSIGARAAGLAHGRTIPREAFEQRFLELRRILDDWSKTQLP